jgi:hypothetical protein
VLRKGQVTGFIIAGVLLLFLVGGFFAMRAHRADIVGPPKIAPVAAAVRPLHSFITECLAQAAEDGLRRIGDSGGYIDPLKSGLRPDPGEPTEGNAIQFAPGSSLLTAQWWHLQSPNDCVGTCQFAAPRPPLRKTDGEASIEGQLEEFIEGQLPACLGDFAAFRQEGFAIEALGQPEVAATVAEKTVFFVLRYPFKAARAGADYNLKDYVAEFDLPLQDIYLLAKNLTELEAEYRYLENAIRYVIDAFSTDSNKMLPPVSEFTIGLHYGSIWTKHEVEKNLGQLLESYIPFIQVQGTRGHAEVTPPQGFRVRDAENFRALYNRGFLVPQSTPHPRFDVKYSYLGWWPMHFDLNCAGQLCRPESLIHTFGFFIGFQRYNFAYDVSLPVLVELVDEDAFNKKGYSFKLFLEANMRASDPLPAAYAPEEQVSIIGRTLLCNPGHWTSGNVTIRTLNARDKSPVADAALTYRCGTESCIIGTTDGSGTLTTRLPPCIGGVLGAEALDLHPAFKPLDTTVDDSQERTLLLEPIRLRNVSAKKFLLKKSIGTWVADVINPVSQKPDEQTLIALERVTGPYEAPFSAFAIVSGDPAADDSDTDIPFIPGTYTIDLLTTKAARPPLRILPQQRCEKKHDKKKCFFVPQEPVEFNSTNPFPGGFSTLNWTVTADELDGTGRITFFSLFAALDLVPESQRVIEDLEAISQVKEYAAEYAEALQPAVGP